MCIEPTEDGCNKLIGEAMSRSTFLRSLTPRIRYIVNLVWVVMLCFGTLDLVNAAPADKEKGQQCSDGVDNDGDGLIDGLDPDCAKAGNDSSTDTSLQFHVQVVTEEEGQPNPWSPDPGVCAAYTVPGDTNFRVRFARHMQSQCAEECWVYLDLLDDFLTDDIALELSTKRGKFTGFAITGQDWIGKEGIMHESDVVPLDLPVPNNPELGFEIPIYSDVVIHRLSGHLAGRRVATAGVVHVGKLIYTPCGGHFACPSTWPVEEPNCP